MIEVTCYFCRENYGEIPITIGAVRRWLCASCAHKMEEIYADMEVGDDSI